MFTKEQVVQALNEAYDNTCMSEQLRGVNSLPWAAASMYAHVVRKLSTLFVADDPTFDVPGFVADCGVGSGG